MHLGSALYEKLRHPPAFGGLQTRRRTVQGMRRITVVRNPSNKQNRAKSFQKKLSEYRKFLKDDYDWDYAYILKLLAYKLKRTRECILSNNIVVSAPKIAKQIQEVETLLNRVTEDSYEDEILKEFHKKYGRLRTIKLPTNKEKPHLVPVQLKFRKETKENSAQIHREFRKLLQKAHRMKERDLNKAFDLMKKNIWGWWD